MATKSDRPASAEKLFRFSAQSPSQERDIFVHHYRLDKTIGQGTYGKVKLAFDTRTGEKVAVKVLEKANIKSEKQVSRIQREIRFLKLLHHPHIVKVYDVMETSDCIYIVMEYATGGELFDYIVAHKRVKEKEARSFFRQVISAVDYCHQNAVIHRDLKPENLLLDQNKNIKIIDFGFGNTYKSDGLLDTFCGSPFYAAPEMILGKKYEGPEVDMWSLGVILFALLCGHLPFDDENMKELYKKIAHGSYTIPEYVPLPCKQLIQRMITVDPRKRATLEEIKNHPWVSEGYAGPPENHLPRRTILSSEELDKNIMQRMQAFGFKNEEIMQAFTDYASQASSDSYKTSKMKINPIITTYFLLSEMLKREEVRLLTVEKEKESPVLDQSSKSKRNSTISPSPLSVDASTQQSSPNLYSISEDNRIHKDSKSQRSNPSGTPKVSRPTTKNVLNPALLIASETNDHDDDIEYDTSVSNSSVDDRRSTIAVDSSQSSRLTQDIGNERQYSGSATTLESKKNSNSKPKTAPKTLQEDPASNRRLSLQAIKGGSIKDKSPSSSQTNSPSSSSVRRKQAASEVRQVSGWFLNVSTTSSKSPEEIFVEVIRVLSSLSYAGVRHEKDYQNHWMVHVEVQLVPFNQNVEQASVSSDIDDYETSGIDSDESETLEEENTVRAQTAEEPSSHERRTSSSFGQSTTSIIRRISAFGNDLMSRGNVVSFQIEICQVPRLSLYGLHFKRMSGSVWSYKSVCSRLLNRMNL